MAHSLALLAPGFGCQQRVPLAPLWWKSVQLVGADARDRRAFLRKLRVPSPSGADSRAAAETRCEIVDASRPTEGSGVQVPRRLSIRSAQSWRDWYIPDQLTKGRR